MVKHIEFAEQYFDGKVWMPILPRWTRNANRIEIDATNFNKLDFAMNKRMKRRLVMRVVSEPEEIGVEWFSGKDFKITEKIAKMRKRMAEVLADERKGQ